jgi:alpha-N-arabinofuranosidase
MNHPTVPNPIIPGFAPDLFIFCEGEDYYASPSTFEYFPGYPIYHSRDLIHWSLFSHAWHRPEQFDIRDRGCSDAMAATSICKVRGRYYLFSAITFRRPWRTKMFYLSADSMSGPWSDPVWLDAGNQWTLDPAYYEDDDGKGWLFIHGQGAVVQQLDIETGKATGDPITIWKGTGRAFPESSRLYRRNGWYYLMLAEGGTHQGHCAVIARSRNFLGPYEDCPRNPVISHEKHLEHPLQCVGHSHLFDDHRGLTWAPALGIRTLNRARPSWQLGREAFLLPVTWGDDDWPVFGDNGLVPNVVAVPPSLQGGRDDFDLPTLDGEWVVARHIEASRADLTGRPGWLRLHGSWRGLENMDGPTALLRRQRHHHCRVQTLLEFQPTEPGQEAGLCVFVDTKTWASLSVYRLGHSTMLRLRFSHGDETRILRTVGVDPTKPVQLEVEALADRYVFSFEQGLDEPRMTVGEVPASAFIPYYTGTMIGLFCTGNTHDCAQPADFDWFEYKAL